MISVDGYRLIFKFKRALNPNGIYDIIGGRGPQLVRAMLLGPMISATGSRRARSVSADTRRRDMDFIGEFLNSRKAVRFMDKRFR
jgi:hypothetical protein